MDRSDVLLQEELISHVNRAVLDVAHSVHSHVKDGLLVYCMGQSLTELHICEPGQLGFRHSIGILVQHDKARTWVGTSGNDAPTAERFPIHVLGVLVGRNADVVKLTIKEG